MVNVFLKLAGNKFGMRAEIEKLEWPETGALKYWRIDKKTGSRTMGFAPVKSIESIEEAPEKNINIDELPEE